MNAKTVLGQMLKGTLAAALPMLIFTQAARADYFKSYNADAQATAPDPTSADGGAWSLTAGGAGAAGISRGAGTTGTRNFWNVTDNATNGSLIYNVAAPADTNISAALRSSDGWKLSMTLRVNSSIDPTFAGAGDTTYGAATWLDIRTGVSPADAQSHLYALAFINDSGRGINGIYNVSNGGTAFDPADPTKLISNVDVSQFHKIDLVMVPNNTDHSQDAVFIYIDDGPTSIFTLTGSNVGSSTLSRIQFGSAAQGQTQNVDWENVTFQSPAPEPASLALLGSISVIFLGKRSRRRA